MKTLTLIAILFFILSRAILADDSAIYQIRKEYQSIQNASSTLKVETKELSGYSTEGGETKAYRDSKGNIRLLKIKLYFESGKTIEEYYYQNGLLIFALCEEHKYNVPFNVTPKITKEIGGQPFDPKKTIVTSNRYYFKNGKMIRWLNDDKKEVNINSKEFIDEEKYIMNNSKKLLTEFK